MGTSARPAGGKARNTALQGEGINTGSGMPHVAGPSFADDFIRGNHDTDKWGDKGWKEYTSGAGGSFVALVPTTVREIGIVEILATASPAGTVYSLHQGVSGDPVYDVPIGSVWSVKAAPSLGGGLATGWDAWAGFIEDYTKEPSGLVAVDFVGIRYTAGNWEAVCRNGLVETAQTIAVASDLVFTILGFERTDGGYQFFTLDCSNPRRVVRTDVVLISTDLPNTTLVPVIGVGSPEGPGPPQEAHGIAVDWWDWGGRTAR